MENANFLNFNNFILQKIGFDLYKHQRDITEKLLSFNSVYLSMINGSGKRTIIDLCSIYSIVYQAQKVIYVSKFDEVTISNRIRKFTDEFAETITS